jgi:predicted ATP-grasp superfamily ATP-dependent carboligase
LIGFDFICDGDRTWLLEVNPRYTASAELLELVSGNSLLHPGVVANPRDGVTENETPSPFLGKQILYAERTIKVPDLTKVWKGHDPWQIPDVADIPHPDSWIEASWPICTAMATGRSVDDVKSKLTERAVRIFEAIES